jgi:hypothetical protein
MKARLAMTVTAAMLLATSAFPQITGTPPVATAATPCSSPMTIDDFSSGAYNKTISKANTTVDATKMGSMLGGQRFTRFAVGTSPYENPSTLLVNPGGESRLVMSSGYKGFTGIQVFYGLRAAGAPVALDADLSCNDVFRVQFEAADVPINFNLQVRSGTSGIHQCGQNTPGGLTNGFVAEFPYDCFTNQPVAWNDIDMIVLLIGTASAVASNDYSITKVEATTGGCGLPICPPSV